MKPDLAGVGNVPICPLSGTVINAGTPVPPFALSVTVAVSNGGGGTTGPPPPPPPPPPVASDLKVADVIIFILLNTASVL